MNLPNIVWCILPHFDSPFELFLCVLLAGEGIWHYFPAGSVAHHHASAHQENHTGWREWSLLNFFHPHSLSKSLASSFLPWTSQFHFSTICKRPVTQILFTGKFSFLVHDGFVFRTLLSAQCCKYGHKCTLQREYYIYFTEPLVGVYLSKRVQYQIFIWEYAFQAFLFSCRMDERMPKLAYFQLYSHYFGINISIFECNLILWYMPL